MDGDRKPAWAYSKVECGDPCRREGDDARVM